jgi:hypothetical protein
MTILSSRVVGKDHLRLRIREGRWTREAIGFGLGSWHPFSGEGVKMAFVPQVSIFRGKRYLQMKIIDLKPSEENQGKGLPV